MTKTSVLLRAIAVPLALLTACTVDSPDQDHTEPVSETDLTPEPRPGSTPASPNVPLLAQVIFGTPTANGSGCAQGNATATLSPDHATLSVTTPAFVATSATSTDARKFCQAVLPVQPPPGIRVGIATADLAGVASVPAGNTLKVVLTRYSAVGGGADNVVTIPVTASGAVAAHADGVTWSVCGAGDGLNLKADFRVIGASVGAQLRGTSFTGHLVAELCP